MAIRWIHLKQQLENNNLNLRRPHHCTYSPYRHSDEQQSIIDILSLQNAWIYSTISDHQRRPRVAFNSF